MGRPEIRTRRLLLTPMTPQHAVAVVGVFADPAVSRYLSEDFSRPGAADRMVARRLASAGYEGLGSWVLVHEGDVVGVGYVGRRASCPRRSSRPAGLWKAGTRAGGSRTGPAGPWPSVAGWCAWATAGTTADRTACSSSWRTGDPACSLTSR